MPEGRPFPAFSPSISSRYRLSGMPSIAAFGDTCRNWGIDDRATPRFPSQAGVALHTSVLRLALSSSVRLSGSSFFFFLARWMARCFSRTLTARSMESESTTPSDPAITSRLYPLISFPAGES